MYSPTKKQKIEERLKLPQCTCGTCDANEVYCHEADDDFIASLADENDMSIDEVTKLL